MSMAVAKINVAKDIMAQHQKLAASAEKTKAIGRRKCRQRLS
jgi:hypothetical protein